VAIELPRKPLDMTAHSMCPDHRTRVQECFPGLDGGYEALWGGLVGPQPTELN